MEAPMTDTNSEQHFPAGPAEALEQLMAYYGSMVLHMAFFYLGDRHLAEDASQEVFIRAYRGWPTFRGESSVKTWLTSITINLCRDMMRSRSSSVIITDPLLVHRTCLFTEEQIIARINRTSILKHVLDLSLPYREVLYHYYYLGFTTREIAEVMGSTEGTIRSRLHRARELLRGRLEKEGY